MRAKAITKGFYRGRIIYSGEVFEVEQNAKATWFDVLVEKIPETKVKRVSKSTLKPQELGE